jgi:hypothetical protein
MSYVSCTRPSRTPFPVRGAERFRICSDRRTADEPLHGLGPTDETIQLPGQRYRKTRARAPMLVACSSHARGLIGSQHELSPSVRNPIGAVLAIALSRYF